LGTLSMPAQDRLLRATEYGEITRIGASRPISVDVRIVAATNENLPAQVDKGKFRADLLDRLSFEVITLPPLRARQGDIPLLAEHFGSRMACSAPIAMTAETHDAPPSPSPVPATSDFRAAVADYERQLLEDALGRNRFNQRATAAALGLSYDQLRHALKRHRLQDAS